MSGEFCAVVEGIWRLRHRCSDSYAQRARSTRESLDPTAITPISSWVWPRQGRHETTCTNRNEGKGALTRQNRPSFGPSRVFGNGAESTLRAPGWALHHAAHVLACAKAQVNDRILGRRAPGRTGSITRISSPLAHRAPLQWPKGIASRAVIARAFEEATGEADGEQTRRGPQAPVARAPAGNSSSKARTASCCMLGSTWE